MLPCSGATGDIRNKTLSQGTLAQCPPPQNTPLAASTMVAVSSTRIDVWTRDPHSGDDVDGFMYVFFHELLDGFITMPCAISI